MKKICLIGLALLGLLLHSCSDDGQDDAPVGASGKPSKFIMPVDKDEANFAVQAADKGMAEVELGRLAIKKGTDKRVKNLGAMIVKAHIKADEKLLTLAKEKKIGIPLAIDTDEEKNIAMLAKASGRDFDRECIDEIIAEQQNNIKLFHIASKQLMDPDMRGYAAKNLLTFQRQLDAVNMIKGSMK